MNLVINNSTKLLIDKIAANLPQSVLLTGPAGVGLSEVANYICNLKSVKPIVILPEKDEKTDLEKGVISVDIMRRLYDEVRTKTDSQRIIVIDYAETMTTQAQNAFLKLLEEPASGIYFILLSHSVSRLLPTIMSRVEQINVRPVSAAQSNDLLDDLDVSDKTKRGQVLFIAPGLPAEIIRLCENDEYFANRSEIMHDAKELLQGSNYKKLLIAHKYKDNRPQALTLLSDAANMLKKSMLTSPHIDSVKLIDQLLTAYQQVKANGNIRLCIARVVFSNLL